MKVKCLRIDVQCNSFLHSACLSQSPRQKISPAFQQSVPRAPCMLRECSRYHGLLQPRPVSQLTSSSSALCFLRSICILSCSSSFMVLSLFSQCYRCSEILTYFQYVVWSFPGRRRTLLAFAPGVPTFLLHILCSGQLIFVGSVEFTEPCACVLPPNCYPRSRI